MKTGTSTPIVSLDCQDRSCGGYLFPEQPGVRFLCSRDSRYPACPGRVRMAWTEPVSVAGLEAQ